MAAMRVLLLGGTTEASMLARHLAGDVRFAATLSFAGVTDHPVPPPIAWRVGGFGGADGLRTWLHAERIEAVIDATHPYAVRISRNAAVAAAAAAVPLWRVERPPWTEGAGDRWIRVGDAEAAAAALGETPQRVLLTLGSKGLAAFRDAPMHRYVVRCIDAPAPALLPPHAELVLARGPFALADETALLAAHRITRLVSKNSGGTATAAKLTAARQAGIVVVMIDRPPAALAASGTVAQALDWLEARHRERLMRGSDPSASR